MSLESVYRRLPVPAQHAAVSAWGLWWRQRRFGGSYRRHLRDFAEREHYDAAQWRDWQARALREVLGAAADHVPHYRETWSDEQRAAARRGELEGVPPLEKGPVRTDPRRFVDVRDATRGELTFRTSGSTGTPVASIWRPEELRASIAVRELRSARWAGVSFSRPRATFSGRMVVPDPHSEGPFHRWNLAERQVYFSPFHLSAEHAPRYVEALHRHRVDWLTGYANSFHQLADLMLLRDLEPPSSLRAVVTTSEKLLPAMRETMEEAYRCRVREEYSTVENVLFASECERGSLHVSPDVGIVEILDREGRPCPPGVSGEVVATQTLRRHQPLVRYRLGDLAAWSEEGCACGRALPVLAGVEGRVEETIRTPDGRVLGKIPGIYVGQPGVREGQIVQDALDHLTVRLVGDHTLVDQPDPENRRRAVEASVRSRLEERVGSTMRCTVEWTDEIARTAAGKFPLVLSLLDEDEG